MAASEKMNSVKSGLWSGLCMRWIGEWRGSVEYTEFSLSDPIGDCL